MRTIILSLFILLLVIPQVLSEEIKPLVLVGCFDAQWCPPEFCSNYTKDLVDLATDSVRAKYGEEIEVRSVSDWYFLLDAITQPNVIGAIISLREGLIELPELRQEEFVSSFEGGLGLIGIHALGYSPFAGRISREVFPLDGNKVASGKIHRNKVITSVHTHNKYTDHPINSQSPDVLKIPDSGLVYRDPIPEEGWWTPEEGKMTVLYVSTTVRTGREVPSVVLYESGSGRSVIFAGLRHTDAPGRYERDVGWFKHSLYTPELRQLLASSLVYVLEPFAGKDSLVSRMEESRTHFEEKLADLQTEMEMGEEAQKKRTNGAIIGTLLVAAISAFAVIVIAYIGFMKS